MRFADFRGRIEMPFSRASVPRHRKVARPGVTFLVLPFLLLALLIGMLGGTDSPQLVAIVGGAVLSLLVLLLLPLYGMFLCLLVLTFVLQGSSLYFLKFHGATWLSFGLAILFFCRVLLDLALRNRRPDALATLSGGFPVIASAMLFLTIFVISLIFNRTPVSQIVSSTKSYLPMFSVLFALYWFRWSERQVTTIWRLMVIIVFLQLPVVLYQHFFVMSAASFDAVVGTFGGMPGKGGNSAIMVLFTVIVVLYGMARWDAGLMSGKSLLALVIVGIALIFLGEVKASIIWLPLGALWIWRKRAMKSMVTLIVFSALAAGFVSATYFVYQALYWGNSLNSAHTTQEKLEQGGGYFFDPNNVNYRTGEISRGASLALWARDPVGGVPERLVGYGPSASKPGGVMGAGKLAARYAPLNLNATALAVLLWDVGLLGALAYVGILGAAAWSAVQVTRSAAASLEQRAIANTVVAALFLFGTLLIYNRAIIDEPTAQLLLMLCVGMAVQARRYLPGAAAST